MIKEYNKMQNNFTNEVQKQTNKKNKKNKKKNQNQAYSNFFQYQIVGKSLFLN